MYMFLSLAGLSSNLLKCFYFSIEVKFHSGLLTEKNDVTPEEGRNIVEKARVCDL